MAGGMGLPLTGIWESMYLDSKRQLAWCFMAQKKKSAPKESTQLTEYAQGVIEILKRLGVITAILTIPTTALLVAQQDLRQAEIYLADAERTAQLSVDPERSTVISGELFEVKVNLNAGGTQITEAKAVLRYDQNLIKVEEVKPVEFSQDNQIDINNDEGRTVVRSFFTPTSTPNTFTWLRVILSTHNQGMADFWFDCRRDAEDETNVFRFGGGDIVNCNNLGQGWFTVNLVNRSVVEQAQPQGGTCGQTSPAIPGNLSVQSGPGRGEVTLKWDKVANASHYTVSYGSGPGSYQYGSPDIGDTDQFVVKGLVAGRQYFFVVTAVNGCASSGYSNIVSTTAGYGTISKTTYDYSGTQKGYQPPIPPEFLPDGEAGLPDAGEEATPAAGAVTSPQPSASPRPSPEATQPVTKPWERLDFWLLAGGIALGGFLLILIGSLLGRGSKGMPPPAPPSEPGPPAEEVGSAIPTDQEESLPPSPWEQELPESTPTRPAEPALPEEPASDEVPQPRTDEPKWPPPPPPGSEQR